ncbi:PREDICTED: uncharacterized protein LOC108538757 [Rhinopithecus bieti]|uniref:uncharacterized protein LOC108538757 n=1 Tax=Rhinopithecus bieti TaxID=61621 RepID=UPI00083C0C18|nr:PREDICTED: uncharacterized protein LOC108538757 [Rhinopithecus bieti]
MRELNGLSVLCIQIWLVTTQHRNPSVLRRWNKLMCTLGIGMTSSPNERSRLWGKRSRRETRAEPCVAVRVEEEKRSQWNRFPASLTEGIPDRGRGERGTNDNFKSSVIPNGLEVTSLKK